MAVENPNAPSVARYSIIVPDDTLLRAAAYLNNLRSGTGHAGLYLEQCLQGLDLAAMAEHDLLGALFDTKQPQIFAEMSVCGDGSDWNLTELGLLGDISVAVPVIIFDDGRHSAPAQHDPPVSGVLVFTPGALLRNGSGYTPADLNEVTRSDGELSAEGYYELYRRRLLDVFRYINERAAKPRSAFVTIPGLGCGQFAGSFTGELGLQLQSVLQRLLTEHGAALPNIRCVYFDPYHECDNFRREIHGISFMVRPLTAAGNSKKSQLCEPGAYAEEGDDFSTCALFSIVAWDHVSWPGNDFFIGSRATDDGVKAAATNSMTVITGVEGAYDPVINKYQPPQPYSNWRGVVEDRIQRENLRLWNPLAVYIAADPVAS